MRKKILFILAFCSLFLLVFAGLSHSQAKKNYKELQIILPGRESRYSEVKLRDVNADGRLDIIALGTQCPGPMQGLTIGKGLLIYLQNEKGEFPAKADKIIVIPPDVSAIDLQSSAKGKEACLLFLSPKRFWLQDWKIAGPQGEKSLCLADEDLQTFFRYHDENLLWLDCIRDLDNDGLADLLIPRPTSYQIYYQEQDGTFLPGQELQMEMERSFYSSDSKAFYYSSRMPPLASVDLNGDGQLDLCGFSPQSANLFIRKGRHFEYLDLRLLEENEVESRQEFAVSALELRDLNGDGLTDYASSQIFGAFGMFDSLSSKIRIRLASADRPNPFEGNYDQVMLIKGIGMPPAFADVDGDGSLDIIASLAKTDAMSAGIAAMTGKLPVEVRVYLFDPEKKRYHPSPDFMREIVMNVGSVDTKKLLPVLRADADLNGDGNNDLMRVTDEEKLEIFFGSNKPGKISFPNSPSEEYAIPKIDLSKEGGWFAAMEPIDSDAKPDILFLHRAENKILLFLSGGAR